MTFAEANGLRRRTIALLYAARNALLPNVTAFGLSLGAVRRWLGAGRGRLQLSRAGQPALHRGHQPRLPADAGAVPGDHASACWSRSSSSTCSMPARPEGAPMSDLSIAAADHRPPGSRTTVVVPAGRRSRAARAGAASSPGRCARCGATARPGSGWSSSALIDPDRDASRRCSRRTRRPRPLHAVPGSERHQLVRHHRQRPGRVLPDGVRRPGVAAGRAGRPASARPSSR